VGRVGLLLYRAFPVGVNFFSRLTILWCSVAVVLCVPRGGPAVLWFGIVRFV